MPRREHVADSQQTLTESLLLSFLGALLGILIAIWIVTALKSLVGSQIPHVESAGIDATVLLFTTAVMLLTGALCGLAPALRSAPNQFAGGNQGRHAQFSLRIAGG